MKYNKPHTSYKEQVNLLILRGLTVDDFQTAEKIFHTISYYRFSAYGLTFQNVKDVYDKGITFETILRLYRFDHELRMLCFDLLEHIEIAIRTQITYEFTKIYGPFGYTTPANFSQAFDHQKWFNKIVEEMDRAKETFIRHYKKKYIESQYLPLWMATEVFSFGSLSKMYSGMKRKDKRIISNIYEIDDNTFANWLHVLVYLRNLCAHHARLWNRTLGIIPSYPNKMIWDNICNGTPQNKVFSVMVIMSFILKKIDSPFNLTNYINSLFTKYPEVDIQRMGFPENWEAIFTWEQI